MCQFTIPGNIKEIGDECFKGCINLGTVEYLGKSYKKVQALTNVLEANGVTIGADVFSETSMVYKQDMSNLLTYRTTDGQKADVAAEVWPTDMVNTEFEDNDGWFVLYTTSDQKSMPLGVTSGWGAHIVSNTYK